MSALDELIERIEILNKHDFASEGIDKLLAIVKCMQDGLDKITENPQQIAWQSQCDGLKNCALIDHRQIARSTRIKCERLAGDKS